MTETAQTQETSLKTGTPLDQVAAALGMTIPQLTRYAMYLGVVCVMLGIGATYITVAIGVAYPVFMSFIALESKGGDDDKQWLTYWVVFGILNIIDNMAGFILSFIPFYFFLKLCFLIFLMHPSTQGATMVYNTYILPTVQDMEGSIQKVEKAVADGIDQAKDGAEGLKKKVM